MDLFGDDIAEDESDEEAVLPAEESGSSETGLRPPAVARLCLGHEKQEASFLTLLQNGRLPHAMIFSGPEGIGKATMAFRLARFLLVHGGGDPAQDGLFGEAPAAHETLDTDPENRACRLVSAGSHPDLLFLERRYDEVKNRRRDALDVESIRRIAPFMRRTASEGGWRIVIVDDADTMNRSSQNALLKILEEPPPKALLILVAHRPGALVATIRSRARPVNFQPLAPEILAGLLERQGYGAAERETLAYLAAGSVGRALQLAGEGGLEIFERILGLYGAGPGWRWSEVHRLAEDLARSAQDQGYKSFARLLPWISMQILKEKARGRTEPEKPLDSAAFKKLMQNSSLEQLSKICENLQEHFRQVERANLDKRQGVLQAFALIGGPSGITAS